MLIRMNGEERDGDGHGGGFLVPCVLLMLHGGVREMEELRELVTAFGLRRQAAEIEDTLQRLQDDELVRPAELPGRDQAVGYALSAEGRRWLQERSDALAEPARVVTRFLDRYGPSRKPSVGGRASAPAVGD